MNRMIPNSIASEPVNGWRNRVKQSGVALEWLTWCDHQQRQHALELLSPEDLDDHDHDQTICIPVNASTFNTSAMPASIASAARPSSWMGTAKTPTLCTNSRVVSSTGVPAIIPTVTKNICATAVGPCGMCTSKPNKKSKSFKP